jgi:oligosaccharide reducing-end xylanase
MKYDTIHGSVALLSGMVCWLAVTAAGPAGVRLEASPAADPAGAHPVSAEMRGAYFTGVYPDLFSSLLGLPEPAVRGKIDSAFARLFYGRDSSERVYYPVGKDMAYVMDVANNDVRTEGMSYGMMIAVQLNKRGEFDRLWKWAKTHMQFAEGPHRGYFAWHCRTDGVKLDSTAASDGEEWFVMALFFASARWGEGTGIFAYRTEARAILRTMVHKESEQGHGVISAMFDRHRKLVVFVPEIPGNGFTDPSYQLPHYYELWARWGEHDENFWCSAASASRRLLRLAADTSTGLSPDYATFDGKPTSPWGGGHGDFRFDAWRVAMNVAVDWLWFRKDPWQVTQSNRLLEFFHTRGVRTYGNQFTLDGRQIGDDHSTGLVAMNAVAALAATSDLRKTFVEELWRAPIPSGFYRYYDGMLYMLALLQVGGEFRIYDPTGTPVDHCSEEGADAKH